MSYTYILSALPALKLQSSEKVDQKSFFSLCRQYCPKDYDDLCFLLNAYPFVAYDTRLDSVGPMKEWFAYCKSLRSALALRRDLPFSLNEKKLQADIISGMSIFHASRILEHPDPLLREFAMIEYQWKMLDILESPYHYQRENIYIYAIRIVYAKRIGQYHKERGWNQFSQVMHSLTQTDETAHRYVKMRNIL